MIIAIPYTEFNPAKVTIHPQIDDKRGRPIHPMSYRDTYAQFTDVSIVTPPLTFSSYDSVTGRIVMECHGAQHRAFNGKMVAFQKHILTHIQPEAATMSAEDLDNMLQKLYTSRVLTLYTFPSTLVKLGNGTTCPISELKAGSSIRCAVRLYGVMRLDYKGIPQLRIQHSVPSIWLTV